MLKILSTHFVPNSTSWFSEYDVKSNILPEKLCASLTVEKLRGKKPSSVRGMSISRSVWALEALDVSPP